MLQSCLPLPLRDIEVRIEQVLVVGDGVVAVFVKGMEELAQAHAHALALRIFYLFIHNLFYFLYKFIFQIKKKI